MIYIPISNGELIDKLTILEIKKEKIKDTNKLFNIEKEYNELKKINKFDIDHEYQELKNINLKLWNIEDKIRIKEKNNEFDNEFIELAREVYKTNDIRYSLKNKINNFTNSNLIEEKSYKN